MDVAVVQIHDTGVRLSSTGSGLADTSIVACDRAGRNLEFENLVIITAQYGAGHWFDGSLVEEGIIGPRDVLDRHIVSVTFWVTSKGTRCAKFRYRTKIPGTTEDMDPFYADLIGGTLRLHYVRKKMG